MIALALVTLGLLGNLAPIKDLISTEEFQAIGAAFLKYHDTTKRGPGSADDLPSYLKMKEEESNRLVDLLKKKDIVFHYNVSLGEMPDGPGKTILAYTKATPKEGGLTLFADGEVKRLTADEFKKFRIARPIITAKDLRMIGFAYQVCCDALARGPAKADEVGRYIDTAKGDAKRLTDLMKNEDLVFIYNVSLNETVFNGIGGSVTIVAHERNASTEGGMVLYADGHSNRLSASEFKKAHLAKPKNDNDSKK